MLRFTEVAFTLHFALCTIDLQPDTVAVYLLKEIVHTLPDIAVWLQTLRQYSIITIVTRTLDEHLRV